MSDTYTYAEEAGAPGAPLLLLFHGTGGDENNLVPLGRQMMPDAHIVSPRGDVSEGGALRFFRRTGEGVYDMTDLARATAKMKTFVEARIAATAPNGVFALGYSNGANILASLLFEAPVLVDAAVLMHPLIPFTPPAQRGLEAKRIFISAGRRDPICPPPLTDQLIAYFGGQGADVSTMWHEGGHEIRREELVAAQSFIEASRAAG